MTGSSRKRDAHGGADPYSKLAHAQEARRRVYPMVIAGTVVVVLVCAVVAFLLTRSDDSSDTAATGTGAAAAAKSKQETADVKVTGSALPEMPSTTSSSPFTTSSDDDAVGKVAPALSGQSFDGSKVPIDPSDGTPKLIIFGAHWCPHCQAELPLIQQWIADGNQPKGVEIYLVSTSVNPDRGNYPPSSWISDMGWQPKVLLDDQQSTAAQAYGLTSFPYFVMTNGKGDVVARGAGEIPLDELAAGIESLAAGKSPADAS